MADRTTIVLADENHLLRQALRSLLEADPSLSILEDTADALQLPGLVERLQPEVLIANLAMPGLGGTVFPRLLLVRSPRTRVLLLSLAADAKERNVLEALRNGAQGYVSRSATAADLLRAIHDVARGRVYLSPPFSSEALDAYRRRITGAQDDVFESLTHREREVLHLAAEGLGNTEAARELGVSPRTVETHRAHVMRKLALRSQADVIRYALRRGILVAEEPGDDA